MIKYFNKIRKVILMLIVFLVSYSSVKSLTLKHQDSSIADNVIIQSHTTIPNFDENEVLMMAKNRGEPVFCINKEVSSPVHGDQNGAIKNRKCENEFSFNSDNDKLRASIGYLINEYRSAIEINPNYYFAVQLTIHHLLKQTGKSKKDIHNGDLVFSNIRNKKYENSADGAYRWGWGELIYSEYDFTGAYNVAKRIYDQYGAEIKLQSGSLNFSKNGNNYTTSVSFINSTKIPTDCKVTKGSCSIDTTNKKINISIPVTSLDKGNNSITLTVTAPSVTYQMAKFKSCGDKVQEIAEFTTEEEIKTYVATATGKIMGDTCYANFESIKNSETARIALYRKLKDEENKNYTNLLNFNEMNVDKACSTAPCDYNSQSSCLEASYSGPVFNDDNISCYNDTIVVGTETAYCLTTLNLKSKVGKEFNNIKAGQLIINSKIGSEGTLNKKCFLLTEYGKTVNDDRKISEYFNKSKILLKEKELTIAEGNNNIELKEKEDEYYIYEGTSTITLNLPAVYSKLGSGKIEENNIYFDEKCANCRLAGHGLISKLDNDKGGRFAFKFKFNTRLKEEEFSNSQCRYTIKQELIDIGDKELNVEFRSIKTNNPFPGISGNKRRTGYNWSFNISDSDVSHISNITSKEAYNKSYDLNRDAKVDYKDRLFLDCYNKGKINSNSQSYLADYIMQKTNDSYNTNNQRSDKKPIYKIVLNSSNIQEIREDNKQSSYSNWDSIECDSDGNCTNKYLETLSTSKYGLEINKETNPLNIEEQEIKKWSCE